MVFYRTMDLLPLKTLVNNYGGNIFFFVYHAFDKGQSLAHLEQMYQIRTIEAFEKDIAYLMKNYLPISLEDIHNNNYDTSKKYFHLSFDDGLLEVFQHAMPLLLARGIPATVFINPPFVGNQDIMFRYKISLLFKAIKDKHTKSLIDKLTNVFGPKPLRRILGFGSEDELYIDHLANILDFDFKAYVAEHPIYGSMEDLKTWQRQGFSIGAHSMYHPYFHRISAQRRQDEIKKSMDYVVKHFNPSVKAFSYPYNDYSLAPEEIKANLEAFSIDITFGNQGIYSNDIPGHYQRIPMDKTILTAKQALKKHLFQHFGHKFLNL